MKAMSGVNNITEEYTLDITLVSTNEAAFNFSDLGTRCDILRTSRLAVREAIPSLQWQMEDSVVADLKAELA